MGWIDGMGWETARGGGERDLAQETCSPGSGGDAGSPLAQAALLAPALALVALVASGSFGPALAETPAAAPLERFEGRVRPGSGLGLAEIGAPEIGSLVIATAEPGVACALLPAR